MALQHSLVLIKPDAMRRGLAGLVIHKLDEAKLTLVGAKLIRVDEELARKHYVDHVGKPFFPQLIEYITGKLHGTAGLIALAYEGEDAVQRIRALAGETNPEKAKPDTIRGMFGRVTTAGVFENVIHASGTPEEGDKEVRLWFKAEELLGQLQAVR